MRSRRILRKPRRLRHKRKSFNSMLPHEYIVRGDLDPPDTPKVKKRNPVE